MSYKVIFHLYITRRFLRILWEQRLLPLIIGRSLDTCIMPVDNFVSFEHWCYISIVSGNSHRHH